MCPWHRLPEERVFQGPRRYWWAFGVATVDTKKIDQLSTLPGLTIVGLLHDKEQPVLVATMTLHQWLYHTNRDSLFTIRKLIYLLENQGVTSKK